MNKLLITPYILIIGFSLVGCTVESDFQLASESRLPKWFEKARHYSRSDVKMRLFFYTSGKVKAAIYGPAPSSNKITDKIGTAQYYPLDSDGYPAAVFPKYIIITIDGVTEIFEQRRKDDILYIVDDPKIIELIKQNKTIK